MFVAETGPAPSRVVMFLHPLGLDHRMWATQRNALDAELRLLMPDLPGFGRSRSEECGIGSAVAACAERLRSDGEPAVLVGVSYGGYVAALLAANYPELVTGLAISGVRLSVPRYLAALQAAAFRATPVGRLNRREHVRIEDLRIEKQHLIAASRDLAEIDLASSASLIRAPSVVFAPSRDWFARRHAPGLAAAIPDARLIPLPGAGHLWTERRPAPLIACVRALASPESARAL